jgi:uncharacterized membrane protein YfcA
VLAVLLVLVAVALVATHLGPLDGVGLVPSLRVPVGIAAGFGIGVVAALMGVAGGELLIPTIVLLFGLDIAIAGSLSLAVSLPTMVVAFTRYSRSQGFQVVRDNPRFLVAMTAGSIAGTVLGGLLLGVVPSVVLVPVLALLLVVSAGKVWGHR